MASAYVIEVLTRCRCAELRLWLPTDPIPGGLGGPEANRGVFEALYAPSGRVLGPGTWVGVTGLPEGYDRVELDAARSAGIAGIVTALGPAARKDGGRLFGVALEPGFAGPHRLAVVFFDCGRAPLRAERMLDVMRVEVPIPAPVGAAGHACQGMLEASLEHVPAAVMKRLVAGDLSVLRLAPRAQGVRSIDAFEAAGPSSGRLTFTVDETHDDQHVLALTVICPEDGRVVSAASKPFQHQAHPRIELRGAGAARAVPASPPALFRIGPFDGMDPGEADLVHAAFGDLRALGKPYRGKAWTFQLRAQPYRTTRGDVNQATPRAVDGALELTEGGDLGVILAADAAHPRLAYALVAGGRVHARRPIRPTGNPFAPADGTRPEVGVVLRGAGIERTVALPDRAVLFFLDEHELTNVRDGLLRGLDRAGDDAGTPILIAVHALAPCGCVSRLVVGAPPDKKPELHFVGDLAMGTARP